MPILVQHAGARAVRERAWPGLLRWRYWVVAASGSATAFPVNPLPPESNLSSNARGYNDRGASFMHQGRGGAAGLSSWQSMSVTTTIQDTNAPRPGRRFEPTHERALHEDALAACAALASGNRGILVVREMAGPIGVPDMTALVADPVALQARLALDVEPLLNQVDAAIVASAKVNGPRSSRALARALSWPGETVARRIPRLLRAGALISVRPDRYVRPAALSSVGQLYAVEAKVRDRRAAIQQARTYSAWADSYVLVMGPLGAQTLRLLLDDVNADRAGLMVAGKWIRRPVMSPLTPARRFWSAEHFVAAIRTGIHHPSVAP
jgi:hypothetical protein